MKTMSCKQLGGACDITFRANTWEEMVELSKTHGMEMFLAKDAGHLEAIGKMQTLMQDPTAMQKWFEGKKAEFEALKPD